MRPIQSFKKPTWTIIGALMIGIVFQPVVGLTQTQPVATPIGTNSAPPQTAAFVNRGARVHDPSTIVKDGNEFWVFYTGRSVPSYHSKDMVNWENGPRVFNDTPAWMAQAVPQHFGNSYWAPDITRVGDRWLLYYAISVFGKNTSAIGLATNPTLDPSDPKFQWTDQGMVITSYRTNDFNAIDPAVFLDADGKLWLAFGSFWGGIKMIELDPKTGKRIAADSPIYSLAHTDAIEAAYIYRHEGYYYLFVNWGLCCKGANSTYNIRVGRSTKVTGPYFDKNGTDMMLDGGTLVLDSKGRFIGPGHAGIISDNGTNWFSCHFESDGGRGSSLSVMPLRWDTNGWPEVLTDSLK